MPFLVPWGSSAPDNSPHVKMAPGMIQLMTPLELAFCIGSHPWTKSPSGSIVDVNCGSLLQVGLPVVSRETFQFTLCFQSLALSPCRSPAIGLFSIFLCIVILTSQVKSACYSYKWAFMKSLSQQSIQLREDMAYRMGESANQSDLKKKKDYRTKQSSQKKKDKWLANTSGIDG